MLKPSELCPASAALLSKLAKEYFDPSVLQVIEGGIPETTALLEQDWGMIHFTGSERVGKVRYLAVFDGRVVRLYSTNSGCVLFRLWQRQVPKL